MDDNEEVYEKEAIEMEAWEDDWDVSEEIESGMR